MKKILLVTFCSIWCLLVKAQVVSSQNFDTALGWTSTTVLSDASTTISAWSRRTVGTAPTCAPFAGAGMARFNSYNIPTTKTGRLTSGAITFPTGNYRVRLKMYRDGTYPTDADKIQVYYNTTNAAGGTLLGLVNRSTSLSPAVDAEGWYSYNFVIPGVLNGTGYVNILGTSAYGNNIFIDEIVVEKIRDLDIEISTNSLNAIESIGTKTIKGTVTNMGLTNVNAFDLKWQVDNGPIQSQTFSGLNLSISQTYTYVCDATWAATPGTYSVRVWVENCNGLGNDANTNNDSLTKPVVVASQSVARLPLYEKFSSSTCGPCFTFNTGSFNPFLSGITDADMALISYQVNWPSSGDPYYTAEIGSRVSFYSISSAPTLLVDSKESTLNGAADLQTYLSDESAIPSYFSLSATSVLNDPDITVNVNITPYISGSYTLHCAVVENETLGNAATNGETVFHHVLMKMLPDPSGTVIPFADGTPVTQTLQATLSGLFIEEMTDLKVVVFIQDNVTKKVMQAAYATDLLGVSTNIHSNQVRLYPNPSKGIIYVKNETSSQVEIIDINGRIIRKLDRVEGGASIDLSDVPSGVYLAKIVSANGTITNQKIILNTF